MAITRLETFTRDGISVVKATTDDGATGVGQLAPPGTHDVAGTNDITVDVFHRLVAPRALGQDPTDVGGLVDSIMKRTYKYPGTFVLRALCGLDTALWDLNGKRRGESVCELLGGPSDPDPVTAYGSRPSRETDADEEIGICSRFREQLGLEAFKLKAGKRLAYETDEDEWPGRTEAVVDEFRDTFGDDVDLLVDANCGYSVEGAIEIGEDLFAPNDVFLFEEPCPYWEPDWTASVREALDIPVAGGEQNNMFQLWGKDWERIIDLPAVDVVQPDIGYVGGVDRTKRIADAASRAGLSVIPHSPTHSLQKVFTLHLVAAIDNAGAYPFEYQIPVSDYEGMYSHEPHVEDGVIPVPRGPGWGVDVNHEWLTRAHYQSSER